MFKGLAEDAGHAGGDMAKAAENLMRQTADIEDGNVNEMVATEEGVTQSFDRLMATDPPGATSPAAAVATPVGRSTVVRVPARFGSSVTTDYKRTFFKAHPETEGRVVVHHAVEQQTLQRYPGVVSESEMHSLENLRGIPKGDINNRVHLSQIRKEWNRFYKANPSPTQAQLLDFATKLDDKFGYLFNPPIR